jgi:hypothetical protein
MEGGHSWESGEGSRLTQSRKGYQTHPVSDGEGWRWWAGKGSWVVAGSGTDQGTWGGRGVGGLRAG